MSAPMLNVTSISWCRDSHSLFDYESKDIRTEAFDVAGAVTCVRDRDSLIVRALPCGQEARKVEQLCRVTPGIGGGFAVEPAEGHRARRSWLVARDLPEQKRHLAEGDVFKLGRFEFLVRQLSTANSTLQLSDDDDSDPLMCVPCDDAASKVCRICLMDGEDDPDAEPLIAPCKCKGSIEHVHLNCLRHWLQSKIGDSTTEGNSFKYVMPQCELCKTSLPSKVRVDSCPQPLVAVPKTQGPFVVLQGQGKGEPKTLHVVSLATKSMMTLGRSRECDVRVQDVSLSRTHANIHYENGVFVLQDNKSKFGTLLALKQQLHVEAGKRLSIQAGRTVLSLQVPQLMENA